MREWLEWRKRREKEGKSIGELDGPAPPACTMRYLVLEAAKAFGCAGLSGFLAQPREWQAEMVAHEIIKGQREAYYSWLTVEWKRKQTRNFKDPGERQRMRWMV